MTDDAFTAIGEALDSTAETDDAPARGSLKAKRLVEAKLLWRGLGVEIDRVVVDGHEADSTVWIYTNTKRTISLTVADLFSRTRFQATIAAALTYGAPSFKQDTLNEVAGHILGLASVDVAYSSAAEAESWGIAYVSTAEPVPYDDGANVSAATRYKALCTLRDAGRLALGVGEPPPDKVLRRESDGALLVVRSWFHYAVHHHFAAGDRGLSAQRIGSLMMQVGWRRPAATHWKVAARDPDSGGRMATLAVYQVGANWESEALDDVA